MAVVEGGLFRGFLGTVAFQGGRYALTQTRMISPAGLELDGDGDAE